MKVFGGLVFDHDVQKIRGLSIDVQNYKCGDFLEIDYDYDPTKTKAQYITEFQSLAIWLAKNKTIEIAYMGPKLFGKQGKQHLQFQQHLMDCLEDSKAFIDLIQPYYKQNVFGPKQANPSGSQKAILELLFELDPSVTDLQLFAAAIALKMQMKSKKYLDLFENLKSLDSYKTKERFIKLFCEPSRAKRLGFTSLQRAKERFNNPNSKLKLLINALESEAENKDLMRSFSKISNG